MALFSKTITLRAELTLSDEEFVQLRNFIYSQCGIFVADNRKYLLENRLANRVRELSLNSFGEYLSFLRYDPGRKAEMPRLFEAVTTNETSFYRNPPQLKIFQENILPEVVARQKALKDRRLRIWSAGCSTGEEPYTLAIIAMEVLGSELPLWDVRVTANDLSDGVIAAARRGVYTDYALRTTPREIARALLRTGRHGQAQDQPGGQAPGQLRFDQPERQVPDETRGTLARRLLPQRDHLFRRGNEEAGHRLPLRQPSDGRLHVHRTFRVAAQHLACIQAPAFLGFDRLQEGGMNGRVRPQAVRAARKAVHGLHAAVRFSTVRGGRWRRSAGTSAQGACFLKARGGCPGEHGQGDDPHPQAEQVPPGFFKVFENDLDQNLIALAEVVRSQELSQEAHELGLKFVDVYEDDWKALHNLIMANLT
jgi:hypothetical protein